MRWYVDGRGAVAHGPLPACAPLIYMARKSKARVATLPPSVPRTMTHLASADPK
jgi:hypothetical protein